VRADGAIRNTQPSRDLAVGEAEPDQFCDLALAGRKQFSRAIPPGSPKISVRDCFQGRRAYLSHLDDAPGEPGG